MADPFVTTNPDAQESLDDFFEDISVAILPTFEIGLFPTGDDGSSFRTQNDPNNLYQRNNYIERKGALDIRCSCLDVVHGKFSAEDSVFATLIVLEFRFDSRKHGRRFKSVSISLEFKGIESGASAPAVHSIAPLGRLSLVPTIQHEYIRKNASLQLGATAPVGGLQATGSLGWEKDISKETTDQTTVIGSIDLKGRNWGNPNCASWTLLENRTAQTGVPVLMRTAVMLKREDDCEFQCIVKIHADVDFRSSIQQHFGKTPKDDPVLFDPALKPTNKLQHYNVEEIGSLDLDRLCDVTFATL